MESVRKARSRLAKYPQIFGKCSETGAIYAKCVLQKDSVKKDDCTKEFQLFKACLETAAKNMATRL